MIKTIDTSNNNQNNKTTCCPVYNQRLAGYLMLQGFVLVELAKNNRYPDKNVFFFP